MARSNGRSEKEVRKHYEHLLHHGGEESSQPLLHQHSVEIQRFDEMRLMPIALSFDARKESAQLLNQLASDTRILHALYKKYHWLMRGPTFYQLHLLLDKHAEELDALIDPMSERVQQLGGVAVGDPRHVAEITRIARPPDGVEEVPAMLSRLLEAHETCISEAREIAEKTEENGDETTNDLITSEYLPTNERQVWFVAEHLVDMPPVRAALPAAQAS